MTWVLFFDGDCGFCSKSVLKVHALDKKGQVDFAPLQGEFSKKMGYTNLADKNGGTMVFLRESDGRKLFFIDQLARWQVKSGLYSPEDDYCVLMLAEEY